MQYSLSGLVEVAAHQGDFDDLVPDSHKQLTAAVKYEQAADRLPPLGGGELNLIQQTAAHGLVQRREHLLNGAVIWQVKEKRNSRANRTRAHMESL